MPSVFHHLKVPSEKTTALVKVRHVVKWLAEVAKTEIVIRGRKQTLSASGAFSDMSRELLAEGDPWEISRGDEGWIISRGTVTLPSEATRIPKIQGIAIGPDDEDDPPPEDPPQLAFSTVDDLICVKVEFKINHRNTNGPYDGPPEKTPPFEVDSYEWNDWPEIVWLSDTSITDTISLPNSEESTDFTMAFPIARITGGKAFPLRSTNIVVRSQIGSAVAIR